MVRAILVILILILMAVGYFYLSPTSMNISDQQQPIKPEHSLVESKPLTEHELANAKAHISEITSNPDSTLDATTASHFVTKDQLLKLPALSNEATSTEIVNSDSSEQPGSAKTFAVSLNNLYSQDKSTKVNKVADIRASIQSGEATSGSLVRLQELLDQPDGDGKRIFYIHAVKPNDEQGIWGILQSGLTETFARGIKLPQNEKVVTANIPIEADEVLANRKSSYLGKLLHDKVETTYIYNYRQGLLGQNPNLISPGQQLIIVTFTEDELLNVYQHFSQSE
ncbi:hypothetical protein [Neptunomonas concharum]|uniref:Uncharacterized protein n=1 Tax=Neptunomonas concharum TaxID=1031538 RepID=A0A5P1RDF2_9GAMM|nr:hypothetical protein [Neptunomonas concharum]QEQ97285.1 hypothetical protein F0U83_11480 [Neptunomonas concharum]